MAFLLTDKWLSLMSHQPRNGAADGYPYDLDASERHVRPKTGIDKWPVHPNDDFAKLGMVSGFLLEMDSLVWSMGFGAIPYGPITSQLPTNLQWQILVPGLNKYQPQA